MTRNDSGNALGRLLPSRWFDEARRAGASGRGGAHDGDGWKQSVRTVGAVVIAIIGVTVLLSSRPATDGGVRGSAEAAWSVPVDAIWVPLGPAPEVRGTTALDPGGSMPPTPTDDRRIVEPLPDDPDILIPDPDPEPVPPPPARTETYVVRRNDSFWKLAERAFGDGSRHEEILDYNPSLRGKALHPGMKITLPVRGGGGAAPAPSPAPAPEPREYRVVDGDNLTKIARRFGVTPETIFRANRTRLRSPDLVRPGMVLTIPAARISDGTSREKGR